MASGVLDILLKFRNDGAGINSAVSGLKTLALQVGSIAAAYLGVRAAGKGLRDIVSDGARLEEQSKRTGASVRDLMVMQQVFRDSGIEADALTGALNKMQRAIVTASKGDNTSFRDIGLDVEALLKLRPAEQFEAISAAISKIENPAKRTAATMAIFGKGSGQLLQTLRPGAFDAAKRSLGALPNIMERNSAAFERSDQLLERLPLKMKQFWAGVADQLIDAAHGPQEEIDKMDFTAAGQKVGAYLALVARMFRDGKLGEFLSLTLEAGWEEATDWMSAAWDRFCSQDFQVPIWSAIISVGVSLYTSLVGAASKVVAYIAGAFRWIGANVGYWVTEQLRGSYVRNTFEKAFGKRVTDALYTGADTVAKSAAPAQQPAGITSYIADQNAYQGVGVGALTEWLHGLRDEAVAVLRDTSVTDGDTSAIGKNRSARERLLALINAQVAKTDAAKAGAHDAAKATTDEAAAVVGLTDAEIENIKWGIERTQFERQQLVTLASRRRLTVAEREQLASLENSERENLQKLIAEYNRRAAAQVKGSEEYVKNMRLVLQLQQQLAQVGSGDEELFKTRYEHSREKFEMRGNKQDSYQTASGGLEGGMMDYVSQVGTLGDQVAALTQNIASGLTSSIGGAITGLIMKTTTWKEALNSIFTSIVSAGVNAFVQLEMQQVMLKLHTYLFGKALNQAEVADKVTSEGAKTGAEAAGATERATIKTGETVADAANQGAQVATHATAEGAKTGTSLMGAVARRAISLGETVFEIGQYMGRLAMFTVAQVGMTAIAIAQMAVRLPMIVAESLAYVIKAAVGALAAMCAIPIVGPILGVLAMGTIFAAGMSMIGKAATGTVVDGRSGMMVHGIGGPTDDLNPYLLSDGEGVLNAATVKAIGPDTVHYLNRYHELPAQRYATGGVAGGGASAGSVRGGQQTGAGGQQQKPNMTLIYWDMNEFSKAARGNPGFEKTVMYAVKRNAPQQI